MTRGISACAPELRDGALVRALTHMPPADATGVHQDLRGDALVGEHLVEDDVTHGGAADVARAHEGHVQAGISW